jgi:hypothetical protein
VKAVPPYTYFSLELIDLFILEVAVVLIGFYVVVLS